VSEVHQKELKQNHSNPLNWVFVMRLSYIEELVSEYFRHLDEEGRPKFMVSEHVYYQTKAKKESKDGVI
jgi:hypothetical protein